MAKQSLRPVLLSTTVFGILGGLALIAMIVLFAGDTASQYWNPLGVVIVLGGTVAATLIAFRAAEVKTLFKAMGAIFQRDPDIHREIDSLTKIAGYQMRAQMRQTQTEIEKIKNPFLKLGIQLAIDGVSVDEIMHVLNWRIQKSVERENAQARLFRTLATFSPAFGMLGTLVGLINMLAELGSGSLETVGRGLSIALITTVYGVILSNLIFKPIAIKLEQRTVHRVAMMNILLDGVILVRLGRTPALVAESLETMLIEHEDELG